MQIRTPPAVRGFLPDHASVRTDVLAADDTAIAANSTYRAGLAGDDLVGVRGSCQADSETAVPA